MAPHEPNRMLTELPPSRFDAIRPLTDPLTHQLCLQCVAEGTSPGRVWVDDADGPAAALVSGSEGWYLIGDPGDGLFGRAAGDWLAGTVWPNGCAAGWRYSCLFLEPDGWRPIIEPLVADYSPTWHYQQYLRFAEPRLDWESLLPEGFQMVRVDQDLLGTGMPGVEHYGGSGFWSIEDFLERGFGFSAVFDGEIVTWVFADCVVGNRAEIGIHTRHDFRRRGLGSLTVAAAVDFCLSHGLTEIGWHCWSANLASRKTAERAGFTWRLNHTGLEIEFPA